MTRLRCRYTLHLGHWRIPAGCGKVAKLDQLNANWVADDEPPPSDVSWVGGPCPSCSPKMLNSMADFRQAKADQVQWRAHIGGLKAKLPEDAFEGFREER